MDAETWQAVASIANNITVVGVLLAWLFREIQHGKILSDEILEDWKDLKRVRADKLQNDNRDK